MTQLRKPKEPVRIRQKALSNGNRSLYLDIYIDGSRTYEFLKLYLVPERSKADKVANAETMRLAEAVKATRIVDIQSGRYGFRNVKDDTRLFDFYDRCVAERFREDSDGNTGNWRSARRHLERYFRRTVTLAEISEDDCEGFREYLEKRARTPADKPLSANSQHSYFCKFKACLHDALDKGFIQRDPSRNVSPARNERTERCYLTREEVTAMARTRCRYDVLRRAFLFSCLTGVRWSDINKMTWGEISDYDGQTRVTFTQKKTRNLEYLDINRQAASLLGERGGKDERVFAGLKYSSYLNAELVRWAAAAGVSKPVTFHTGRHTFAVMMIDLGTDIYTLQKLLGHTEIRTTQIYAKMLDKKKQEAIKNIPDLL